MAHSRRTWSPSRTRSAATEAGYGDTLYHLRWASIKFELRLGKILDHLHIDDITEDDGDNVLDEE
jgi:hypothetical protein